MTTTKPQAISGVSADRENALMTVYPSISAGGFACWLGTIFDSIPVKIFGLRLSNLLFTLPTIPVVLLLFALQRISGARYTLTNKSVQIWSSIGNRRTATAELTSVADIEVVQRPGQEFYKTADLHLQQGNGDTILKLEGVQRAEVFRETILKARDAANQTSAALATINARQSA